MASQGLFFVLIGVGVVLVGGLLALLVMKYVRSAKEDEARKAREAEAAAVAKSAQQQFETGDWKSASAALREMLAKAEDNARAQDGAQAKDQAKRGKSG